nr:hypothetical protein [Tanacetum cinerariifolium]
MGKHKRLFIEECMESDDNRRGVEVDNFGITSVDFSHLLNNNNPTDEPFILASQAQQLMYLEDLIDPEWEVAIKMTMILMKKWNMNQRLTSHDSEEEFDDNIDDTSDSMDDAGIGKMRDVKPT